MPVVRWAKNAFPDDSVCRVTSSWWNQIRYVCTFYRFVWETSDVYSIILLTQLICVVLHMTCSVFQMDMVNSTVFNYFEKTVYIHFLYAFSQAIKHPDLNFYMVLMSLLVSGANLFCYCFYGKRSSNDFGQMVHFLYESNWNEQPVKLQKFYKMMIANAQRPIFYHGMHIVHLNLETFLKVSIWGNPLQCLIYAC